MKESLERLERILDFKRLKDSKVSIVLGVTNSNTSTLATFNDILDLAKCDEIQEAKKAKGWKHSERAEEYKRLKSSLPAFTITTFGYNGESTRFFVKKPLNPYIIIDIDNIEVNENNTNKLNSFPFVLATGVSVSGEGYYSIVKFNNLIVDDEKSFSILFKKLNEYYKEQGYEIDKSCSNINRLRIVSPYELYWNNSYKEEFSVDIDELEEEESYINEKKTVDVDDFVVIDEGHEDFVVPYVPGKMYNERISWANTIYNVYGDAGYSLFMDIMREQPNKEELANLWKTAHNGYSSSSKCLAILRGHGYILKMDKETYDFLDDLLN